MRTTLTLDEDVAAKLKDEARRSGKPFKQVVNEALRQSLAARRSSKRIPPFRVRPFKMGLRPGLSYDCVSELLEQVEGPGYR